MDFIILKMSQLSTSKLLARQLASGNNIYLCSVLVMTKHSHLSTQLDDLNNIKNYTVDKQYKNRHHIGLNVVAF